MLCRLQGHWLLPTPLLPGFLLWLQGFGLCLEGTLPLAPAVAAVLLSGSCGRVGRGRWVRRAHFWLMSFLKPLSLQLSSFPKSWLELQPMISVLLYPEHEVPIRAGFTSCPQSAFGSTFYTKSYT